ncbi:MAG: mannosyltransferase family protein [uncultured bacterium]|nr:MAG: mannosyltransferase family protein [uncultured bacterium]
MNLDSKENVMNNIKTNSNNQNSSEAPCQESQYFSEKPILLLIASFIVMFFALGARELWTHEGRWAVICAEMLRRNDFFHPYLLDSSYYDKPLLSYWLMLFVNLFFNTLNEWSLRIPGALSGLITVFSTYFLGKKLFNQKVGMLSGWILISTFYFIFWSRIASTDIMNVAGITLALAYYFNTKENPSFIHYSVFFIILSVTCLTKGLIGAVIPLLIIFPDIIKDNIWKKHFNFSFFLAAIPAGLIYLIPFMLSNIFGTQELVAAQQSGLFLVFKENVLRFFQPFDHKGAFYIYFKFFPLYFFPWIFIFIFAAKSNFASWKNLNPSSKWAFMACIIIFGFLTASGSRRSYYILPILPFASIVTAEWILQNSYPVRKKIAGYIMHISLLLVILWFCIIQPFFIKSTERAFANEVVSKAKELKDWKQWKVLLIGGEIKTVFYLSPITETKNYNLPIDDENISSLEGFIKANPGTLIISRKKHENILDKLIQFNYIKVEEIQPSIFNKKIDTKQSVAYIPK